MFHRLISLFLLGYLLVPFSYGQNKSSKNYLDVYPIRVKHKWGYVKFYTGGFLDTIISPRYDYIGDINLPWNTRQNEIESSTFRIFEIDNKLGVLDENLKEVITNQYNRIRPLSQNYFAVETDSLFNLVDRAGTTFFNGQKYSDISPESRNINANTFFFFKEKDKWGVRRMNGPVVIDAQYADIQSTNKKGYFKAKIDSPNRDWQLIDSTGKLLMPDEYEDVKLLRKDILVAKKRMEPYWRWYEKTNNDPTKAFRQKTGLFSHIEKINKHLALIVPYQKAGAEKIELWNLKELEQIRSFDLVTVGTKKKNRQQPWFYPLNDKYAVQSYLTVDRSAIKFRLLNASGQSISAPYDTIVSSNKESIFFAANKMFSFNRNKDVFGWGALSPELDSTLLLECKHEEIYDFDGDYAITRIGSSYGVLYVDDDNADQLPCIYDSAFEADDNKIHVQTGLDVVIYEVNAEGKLEEEGLHSGATTFSKNVEKLPREAEPDPLPPAGRNINRLGRNNWSYLSYEMKDGQLQLLNRSAVIKKTSIAAEMRNVREIEKTIFALNYKSQPIQNPMTQRIFGLPAAQVQFYNSEKDALVTKDAMIGYRPFIEGERYTTFIARDGRMGIINRNGEEIKVNGKAIRYPYIGIFQAGMARVCTNCKLVLDQNYDLPVSSKYRITTKKNFIEEFQVDLVKKQMDKEGLDYNLYAVPDGGPIKWEYITTSGYSRIKPKATYVDDFHDADKTAMILRPNGKKTGVKPDAYYGIIDSLGKQILPVEYNDIKRYQNCYRVAIDSTPTFYFTKKGHQIFVNRTRLRPFSDELALFKSDENKWGYVNAKGDIIIPPVYSMARPFSEGAAMVVDSAGYCSFIDTKGALIFKTRFKEKQWRGLGDFKEGRCWFKDSAGWKWGCYDKNGEIIIEPKFFYRITNVSTSSRDGSYDLPMDFSNGVASVRKIDENKKNIAAIIDTTGAVVFEDKTLKNITHFDHQGLAKYGVPNHKLIGVINSEGKKITPPKYSLIDDFKNGYARVKNDNGKWGLVNKNGKEVLSTKYLAMGELSEGLVAVQIQGRNGWWFVDTLNRVAIKNSFDEVNPFKSGVTLVKKKKKTKIINTSGTELSFRDGKPVFFSEGVFGVELYGFDKKNALYILVDEEGNNLFGRYFSEISPYQLGIAKVRRKQGRTASGAKKKELFGAINKRGVMVVPPKYRNLHIQPDGNIIINPQRFFGLIDRTGKTLLEPKYDLIQYFKVDQILRVEQGEKVGYVRIKNNEVEWLWELQN